ncbi:hypothetical protein QO009_002059 [Brevibacillus aydinogluensis]|uniref:DUF3800 domain-containing protein n=1 Tax=Brevibacillus aydinogluensis TaxID=927786 RepID=UPI002892B2AA|nr:DUF3800 domain-containing protein [Brevibacillus aydinogluensis]MDT3416191.1 hypothetical protein [Brevibacillus aydinogluensis]
MYFVFVDEAGTPGYNKKKQPEGYFSLAGIIIKAERILELEKKLRKLKRDFEIHPNDEFKWSSSYSEFGFDFKTFCEYRGEKFRLINEIAETVIVSVLDKAESFKKDYINDHCDLYQQALYLMMERIHNWRSDRGVTDGPFVFVIDSRKNAKEANLDEKLGNAYRRALRTGTYYYTTGFPAFSETPYFTASESSSGLQLADYCAGAVQQYFTKGTSDWYPMLRPKIRKSADGKVSGFGIKFFPGRTPVEL